MKMKERVAEAMCINRKFVWSNCNKTYWTNQALSAIKAMHEPDPNAVAIVADKLKMDGVKVAAVWMLLVEEMGK